MLYSSSIPCFCRIDSLSHSHLPDILSSVSLSLPDLFFCPECHVSRCFDCSKTEVVSKYCAGCLTDYSDIPGATRCLKNCFECPNCTSPIIVTASNHSDNKVSGKIFHFACVSCAYTYSTDIAKKPAPLTKILRASGDPRFASLCEKYNSIRELKQSAPAPVVGRAMAEKLQLMDLPIPGPQLQQSADFHLKRSSNPLMATSVPILPVEKRLLAKRRYSCPTCNTYLQNPISDPRLIKISEKEFALDVYPVLLAKIVADATADDVINCVLSVINPLPTSINVKIATAETIPANITGIGSEITVSLPLTAFVVPARREKIALLETLPTHMLTDATRASRAEKLARSINNGGQISWVNDKEPVKEQGTNWVSMSFAYSSVGPTQATKPPKIPFYVTVETKMPQKWTSCTGGLKFGFWAVVPLPSSKTQLV